MKNWCIERLNSTIRNQLLLVWNIEMENKGSNGNIKVNSFGVTLDFVRTWSFFVLTLNRKILVDIYCIHFHKYRSSHLEIFFRKGVRRTFSQFSGKHLCKSMTSTLFKSHFCMCFVLLFYTYTKCLQQNAFFGEQIWETASLYCSK